eukprot:g4587.t1
MACFTLLAAKEGKVLQISCFLGSYALMYDSGRVATGGENGEYEYDEYDAVGNLVGELEQPRWEQDNKLGLGPGVRVALVPTLLADPVRAALD